MALKSYPRHFQIVEVQQTFYEPPARASTFATWREAMPLPFEFTIKAWQLVTHQASSSTCRRLKRRKLTAKELTGVGSFKPTRIVDEGWSRTAECASALSATAILFQCPGSFTATDANLANLRGFFERIERPKNVRLLWEPRGPWPLATVKRLCDELGLVHVVDLFVTKRVTKDPVYYRLHGIKGWRHRYTDAELTALAALIPKRGESTVMFNNMTCVADAKRLQALRSRPAPRLSKPPVVVPFPS